METLFENRFSESNEMLSEYIRKVVCKKMRILGYSFALLALVMFIVTIYRHDYVLSAVFGVSMFILLFTALVTPFATMRQVRENNRRLHNGKTFETIVRFGDRIYLEEGSISMSFEYSQVIQTYSLKHSFVMMLGKTNGVLVSPSHFTIGTFEDFKAFLSSKGIS